MCIHACMRVCECVSGRVGGFRAHSDSRLMSSWTQSSSRAPTLSLIFCSFYFVGWSQFLGVFESKTLRRLCEVWVGLPSQVTREVRRVGWKLTVSDRTVAWSSFRTLHSDVSLSLSSRSLPSRHRERCGDGHRFFPPPLWSRNPEVKRRLVGVWHGDHLKSMTF